MKTEAPGEVVPEPLTQFERPVERPRPPIEMVCVKLLAEGCLFRLSSSHRLFEQTAWISSLALPMQPPSPSSSKGSAGFLSVMVDFIHTSLVYEIEDIAAIRD